MSIIMMKKRKRNIQVMNQQNHHISIINFIIKIFIMTNEILIINQDIINLNKISSIFINIKHDL